MKLIGIGGTNGSGKDTVGHFLASQHNFLFVSGSDMLRDELARRGLPPAREHMRELSADWRRQSGLGVLIDKAVEVFNHSDGKYAGLAVASLRNPGEVDRVHELGGKVVWVDADPRVRYDRLQANLAARGEHRAVDDRKTYEQFLADEQAEMEHSGDEATLNMGDVKAKADIFIANDGNDIKIFLREIEKALGSIK
jgi:dephospho-CoA kinase